MAIGVEYRVIQNVGGSARLHNNEVQRLSSPPTSGVASFILPPAAAYTSRVFKVIVPTAKGSRPPAMQFFPADGEKITIVADRNRGGKSSLVPIYGENAYVFHEASPGVFMVYRESSPYRGEDESGDSSEEGGDIMTEYGTIDEDGNLTVVNGVTIDPETGAITFGSDDIPPGTLPVKRTFSPAPRDGYVLSPVPGKWSLSDDGLSIVPEYLFMPAKYKDPGDASEEEEGVAQPVILPFFIRREEEGSGIYVIYLPKSCIKYGKRFIPFDGITPAGGDWYYLDITPMYGNIWCFVVVADDGSIRAKFIRSDGDAPPAETGMLTFFKVAKIDQGGGDGLYDGITQVAGGQEGLLPDDLAAYNTRKPFGIYEADASSSDESDGFPELEMYLPDQSLVADSRPIPIDGIEGDTMPVGAGSWWCVVLARPDNLPVRGSSSSASSEGFPDGKGVSVENGSNLFALVVDSDGMAQLKDKALFSFKIGEVSENGDITQFAFGSVILSRIEDFSRLVPFQLCTVTYRDDRHSLTSYRLYTPANGTVQYNGSFLPIAEAEGNWTELDVDEEEGVYSYVCAIVSRQAHIIRREEAQAYVGSPESPAVFPVVDIVVGGESGEDDELTGPMSAVVVSVEHSSIERDLVGAGISASAWAERLRRETSDVVVLSDNAATVEAVKIAFAKACRSDGLAILVIAAHGGCDSQHNNEIALYDDVLTDADVWAIASRAKGKVWLVFDCCHSGSMYAPGQPYAPISLAAAMSRLAAASNAEVPMLCWAGATDETVGWVSSGSGGMFTQSCMRNTANGESFAAAWEKIKADPALLQWQTPACTVIHDFPTQDIPFPAHEVPGDSSE